MSSDLRHPVTGAAMDGSSGRSPRLTLWMAFLLFSTITLGSSVEVSNLPAFYPLSSGYRCNNNQKRINAEIEDKTAANWAVTCAAITFVVTLIIVISHMIPLTANMFVGTVLEGTFTFILICFWAATVSIVTNTSNGLSVTNDNVTNQVGNANLYYFSWAGFFTSIIIMVDYLRATVGVDVVGEIRNRSARLSLWAGLLAASLVVMGSSSRVWSESCKSSDFYAATYCNRTKFGISLGTITMFLAIGMVALKLRLSTTSPFLMEFVTAFLLSIMNAFGVAYITSSLGPGSAIGNLYYFSWISFLCSCILTASCFEQFKSGNAGPDGGFHSSSSQKSSNNNGSMGSSNGNLNGRHTTDDFDVDTLHQDDI